LKASKSAENKVAANNRDNDDPKRLRILIKNLT